MTGTPACRHRRERLRVARALHPDRGGDPAVYLAALAEVDARFDRFGHRPPPPLIIRRRRIRTWLPARRLRRAVASVRARLPAGWPGSRRYARL